jgi:hypothetical protein
MLVGDEIKQGSIERILCLKFKIQNKLNIIVHYLQRKQSEKQIFIQIKKFFFP